MRREEKEMTLYVKMYHILYFWDVTNFLPSISVHQYYYLNIANIYPDIVPCIMNVVCHCNFCNHTYLPGIR